VRLAGFVSREGEAHPTSKSRDGQSRLQLRANPRDSNFRRFSPHSRQSRNSRVEGGKSNLLCTRHALMAWDSAAQSGAAVGGARQTAVEVTSDGLGAERENACWVARLSSACTPLLALMETA
jgi:hypothetical protein